MLTTRIATIPVPYHIRAKAYDFDREISKLKSSFNSTNYLNKYSHGISKIGEWLFAMTFGMEDCIDWTVNYGGDGSSDFIVNGIKIDIKTSTYDRFPDLKCYPYECYSDVYVLATYNSVMKAGTLVGFISKAKLFDQSNYRNYRGLGNRYAVKGCDLCHDWARLRHYLDSKKTLSAVTH